MINETDNDGRDLRETVAISAGMWYKRDRCGPVEAPVFPVTPITVPCETVWPCDTFTTLKWAYRVVRPPPWSMTT